MLHESFAREMSRRRFLGASGTAVLGGMLLGHPMSAAARTAAGAKRGGTLTWGDTEIAPNLAPFGAVSTATVIATTLIYDSLLTWDRQLNLQPALAESYHIPDPLTYVFNLRKGVKFHSGKEFDAEDVVYSMGLQKAPPPPGVVNGYYPAIARVEAVDKYTVKFHMSRPDATLLTYLAWGWYSQIVPKGLYQRIDVRSQADGTGPFQLESYVPNDHLTLAAYRQPWRPIPYLDKLVIKLLPDLNARISALRSGEIQGGPIDADTARILQPVHTLAVQKGLTAAFREIEFTIHGDGKPWDDVRVRQAVNHAINRQDIIDKVYAGNGLYSSQIPAGYGTWALSQDALKTKYEKFDLPAAQALMAKAGYSNGFNVTLQSIASPVDYTQVAQVIAEQLKAIKINVTVQPLEIGIFATNVGSGKFEWASTGRGMRGDPSGYMADFEPTASIDKAWYKGGFNDPALTKLIHQGLVTTNVRKRHQLYTQMQEIVLTQWPELPLVNPMLYQAVSTRVQNSYLSFDSTYTGLKGAWLG